MFVGPQNIATPTAVVRGNIEEWLRDERTKDRNPAQEVFEVYEGKIRHTMEMEG